MATGGSYNGIARVSLDEIENYAEIAPLFQFIKFVKIVMRVTWTNAGGGSGRTNTLDSLGTTVVGTTTGINCPIIRIYRTPVTENFALTASQIDEMRSTKKFYMQPGKSVVIVSKGLQVINEITANATGAAVTSFAGMRCPWLNTSLPTTHVWGKAFLITSEQTNSINDCDYTITVHRDVYFRVKGLK